MSIKPLWVFGYGSLVWNPGFDPAERVIAQLPGFSRSFCMRSIHHRGSEEEPGLVLALDHAEDSICHGVGFRVHDAEADEVLEDLRARELISSAYLEEEHQLELADGRTVQALAYVIDRDHVQYCGGLPWEEQAQIIAHAVGGRGPNSEYLFNTAEHLSELGLEDDYLNTLVKQVRAILAQKT